MIAPGSLLSVVYLGDPETGEEDVGIVVFGDEEQVARARDEGPFDENGFIELAIPVAKRDGISSCTVSVHAESILEVAEVDWDDLERDE